MKKIVLVTLHCWRCGHGWYPNRPIVPTICPKCKSQHWQTKRTSRQGLQPGKGVSK